MSPTRAKSPRSKNNTKRDDVHNKMMPTPTEMLVGLLKEFGPWTSSWLEILLIPGSLYLILLWLYFGNPKSFRTLVSHGWIPGITNNDPMMDWYQYLFYHFNGLVVLAIIPVMVLKVGFAISLQEMGLCVGDWRTGVVFLYTSCAIMTPLVWVSSLDPEMRREYPLTKLAGLSLTHWICWELTYLVYYIGFEVFHRGILLLVLRKKTRMGMVGAMAFQTSISTLMHLAGGMKPFTETSSAIAGGILFGVITLRTGSVLWALLLHWYIGGLLDVLAYYY